MHETTAKVFTMFQNTLRNLSVTTATSTVFRDLQLNTAIISALCFKTAMIFEGAPIEAKEEIIELLDTYYTQLKQLDGDSTTSINLIALKEPVAGMLKTMTERIKEKEEPSTLEEGTHYTLVYLTANEMLKYKEIQELETLKSLWKSKADIATEQLSLIGKKIDELAAPLWDEIIRNHNLNVNSCYAIDPSTYTIRDYEETKLPKYSSNYERRTFKPIDLTLND